eukprot:SAG11_NODE_4822_length_1754_cov_1.030816_2_plen_98_part_00
MAQRKRLCLSAEQRARELLEAEEAEQEERLAKQMALRGGGAVRRNSKSPQDRRKQVPKPHGARDEVAAQDMTADDEEVAFARELEREFSSGSSSIGA